ncbi:MAG: class I SAM-dependent methyltransferase [Ilumatobacteraceae bacterium]
MPAQFSKRYYDRFYGDDPVHTPERIAHLAGVHGMCGWLELPVTSVLDVGAGPGYWRDWFAEHQPDVAYTGVDVSEYACERYGHDRRDITTWCPDDTYDLVVAQGVIQYLDDTGADAAIEHLAEACDGMLYLELPTAFDRVTVIDADHTDLDVHWRHTSWYRDRLAPYFVQFGGGMWIARRAGVPLYELGPPNAEAPDRRPAPEPLGTRAAESLGSGA